MRSEKIIDLHGNIFTLGDWELVYPIPIKYFDKMIATAETQNHKPFILTIKGKDYYAYVYNIIYHSYIRFELKLIGYDESKDIRKDYLYEKNRKVSKTNGNNRNDGRVSQNKGYSDFGQSKGLPY